MADVDNTKDLNDVAREEGAKAGRRMGRAIGKALNEAIGKRKKRTKAKAHKCLRCGAGREWIE